MRHWTLKERKKQSKLIQQWKPWNQSTGPMSAEGKRIAKMNAYQHGTRSAFVRETCHLMAEYHRFLSTIN